MICPMCGDDDFSRDHFGWLRCDECGRIARDPPTETDGFVWVNPFNLPKVIWPEPKRDFLPPRRYDERAELARRGICITDG